MADQRAPGRKLPSFPLFRGMAGLERRNIPREILAGLTIACVAVPLGLGYGAMAGLPPEVGLYGTILPLAVYAVIGTSRRLVMAPDSSLALIIAGSVIPLALGDPARELQLAMLAALVAGAVLVLGGFLRLGRLAEYVSRPILVGGLTGVGITIVSSQLDEIFGYAAQGDSAVQRVYFFLSGLDQTNVPSLVLGLGSVVAMLVLGRLTPNLPNALIVVAVGSIAAGVLSLADRGVALLGEIPSGLPTIALPPLGLTDVAAVFVPALAIAVLSFVDSSLTARSWAARHGEDIDANVEAVGIGAADIAASVSSGLPASGSGLRSALSEAAGAGTQLAPLVSAGLLLVVMLFFTWLLAPIPWPVLAGILVVAGFLIIDVAGMRTLWRLDRAEFWIAMIAMLGIVFFGTVAGVFLAIFLSMADVIRRLSSPRETVVVPERADGSPVEGVLVYRFNAPLFFGNAELLRARVNRLVEEADPKPRAVVLDGRGISQIDTTATYTLDRLRREMETAGVTFALAGLPGSVRDRLLLTPAADAKIAAFTIQPTLKDALTAYANSA